MKMQKNGSTLVVQLKKGEKVRFNGFHWISSDMAVSDSVFGTRVDYTDGLFNYTFGRIKTIVIVRIPT